MIKVILLKDAEAGRSVVFAKAIVDNGDFSIDVAVGYINKNKTSVAKAGTVAFELPDIYVGKLQATTTSFTDPTTEEVREITRITVS